MKKLKLHNIYCFISIFLFLSGVACQSMASDDVSHNTKIIPKEKIILLPIVISNENSDLKGQMVDAVVQGLSQKYVVFSGEKVEQELHKATSAQNKSASTICDEDKCLQDVSLALGTEIIAAVHATKTEGGYLLSIHIKNEMDGESIFNNSVPCKDCDIFQVINKLKELSSTRNTDEVDEASLAAARRFKAEQIKQEQLDFDEKMRNADASEQERLLTEKAAADKRLDELKAQAELMRNKSTTQNPSDFQTIEAAIAEVKRLNSRIEMILDGYDKDLSKVRKETTLRFSALINDVDAEHPDGFDSQKEFEIRQEKKRANLVLQRDEQLKKIPTASALAADEVNPLKMVIDRLTNKIYTLNSQDIELKIGKYNPDLKQFPLTIKSKSSIIKLDLDKSLEMPSSEARIFQRQVDNGLISPEVNVKMNGDVVDVFLVNDGDNTRRSIYSAKEEAARKVQEQKKLAQQKVQDEEAVRSRKIREEADAESAHRRAWETTKPIFVF